MSKLAPKEPLFAGRSVKESRRIEAALYKDYDPKDGSRPVGGLSHRRIKKARAKYDAGRKLCTKELRLIRYYIGAECAEI